MSISSSAVSERLTKKTRPTPRVHSTAASPSEPPDASDSLTSASCSDRSFIFRRSRRARDRAQSSRRRKPAAAPAATAPAILMRRAYC